MDFPEQSQNLGTQSGIQIPPHILDDLCARFIINLPEEESRDPIRIFFQIEIAHWFYLDFYCPENPELRQCHIKEFSTQVFRHCPSLSKHLNKFDSILESWKEYKMAVPTYGAILLDPTLHYCLLVQGYWVKASWGFPKGKVNQDESPMDCAIREVLEETGFDIQRLINPDLYLESKVNEQISRLYIVSGVSMETKFKARTRNEIKSFEWFRVDHLPSHKKDLACKQNTGLNPNAFFMVVPFIKGLRRFVNAKLGHFDNDSMNSLSFGANLTSVEPVVGVSPSEPPVSRNVAGSVPQEVKPHVTSYENKMRQKAQFAQQMQLEFQEYMGHKEFRKAAAASNSSLDNNRPDSMSPRRPPASTTPRKQKREADKRKVTAPSVSESDVSSSTGQQATSEQSNTPSVGGFVKPMVWTNFKLDIDAVLVAMFPSQLQQHNRNRLMTSVKTN